MKEPRMWERLRRRFQDRKYRYAYLNSFLDTSIAAQIRALREARNMSQQDLAAAIGTKQSGVSALENVNYSRWSLSTLRKLAEAFDVALVVKFVSHGEALEEVVSFDPERLAKPAFEDDLAFAHRTATSARQEAGMTRSTDTQQDG
jgi:transcriptional regulator with XRE-family HTH domain